MKPQKPVRSPFSPAPLSLALACALGGGWVHANPVGGVAVHGTAQMSNPAVNQLVVTTTNGAGTNHSVINWQSFSIPGGSTTQIVQPNAGSLSINRVTTTNNPSLIYGTLSSNGQVLLVNPAGVTVGAGAVVDTAGFQASTLGLSEADAIAGRLRFEGAGGDIQVQGQVVAREGDVVLLAPQVTVEAGGVVRAPNGSVVLAAGQKAELTGRGLEGIQLQVQAPGDRAVNLGTLSGDAVGIFAGTLKHSGVIQATAVTTEGGRVVLKAQELAEIGGTTRAERLERLGGLFQATARETVVTSDALIDVSGATGGGEALIGGGWQGSDARVANATYTRVYTGSQIRADATESGNGGTVVVWADGATAFGGNISAQGGSAGGDGGLVEVSGKQNLMFVGHVDTTAVRGQMGQLWLDPTDINITTGPSNNLNTVVGADTAYLSTADPSVLNVVTLEAALASNDVRVLATGGSGTSTGTISIYESIDWSSGSKLTLQSGAAGGVQFLGTGSVNAASGTLAINAGTGGVDGPTSGGGLLIDTLNITTTGAVTFSGSGTNVANHLTVDAAGPVQMQFNQANALNVGNLTTSVGNISLTNNGTGSLQFNGHVSAAGDLSLTAGTGGMGQTAGSVLEANQLNVYSGGNVSLGGANLIDALQVNLTASNSMVFRNAQSLSLAAPGPAPAAADLGTGASSLSVDVTGNLTLAGQSIDYDAAAGASVKLKASGNVVLNGNIQSSSGTGGTSLVELEAGGNLTGTGVVEADKLAIKTGGSASLTNSQSVLLLAASVGSGGFSFQNGDDLTLGSAGSVSGVTAAGNIDIQSSDNLYVNGAVSSTGGNLQLTAGGDLTVNAGGSVSASQIDLSGYQLTLDGSFYPGRAGVAGGTLNLNGMFATFGSTSQLHMDLGPGIHDTLAGSAGVTFQPGAMLMAHAAGGIPVGTYTVYAGNTGGTLPTLGGSLGNATIALGSIVITVAAPPLMQTQDFTELFTQEVGAAGDGLLPELVNDPEQALADDDIVVGDTTCRPR